MKRKDARASLLLVLMKSLITWEWSNDNSDKPTKLQIFFTEANDQREDDENL